MTLKSLTIGAVFAIALANAATAATVTAKYKASSAIGSGADHSIWISSGLGRAVGSDFNFGPSGMMTFFSNGAASLTGNIVSQNNAKAGFKLAFDYDNTFKRTDGTSFKPAFKSESHSRATKGTFYRNLTGGRLVGTGILAGLNLSVTRKPANGPWATQIGGSNGTNIGANNKNRNFGAANWFNIHVKSATCSICSGNQVIANLNGTQGDLNIDLAPVPVPAAGVLLLTGIGAFAGLRRRRRKS